MQFRTWPVAALALGALLVLIVVSVLESSRRAQEIYTGLDQLNLRYHEVENTLRRLRSDVNLSGIYVRDYLLDTERENSPEYRGRLANYRRANMRAFEDLRELVGPGTAENQQQLQRLAGRLEEYWQTLDPLFDWSPGEKTSQSFGFLQREVIPRREAILAIAAEIEELNRTTMATQRTEVAERQAALRGNMYRLLWSSLLLGIIVAFTAILRLWHLEKRAAEQQVIAREAEGRMRELSQQLVATQEEERRHLSRELHDHVGQVLTALRMELGSIDRLRAPDDRPLGGAVAEARQLVDNMVRTVRDLALGLRPSMLDDFGLQPALEWHVRDFNRRYGLQVDLTVVGQLDDLPDQHRTCVYRVVQEALTNCVKHASAKSIRVTVRRIGDSLALAVTDDGIGLQQDEKRSGLGLRGIEERVRDLGGTFRIDSSPGAGTSLHVELPLAGITTTTKEEATVASAVGG
jgi:signal transduction histidine kinase